MTVTLHLPGPRPVGLVGFAWSPLFEAALSLRPVVHPKRYPMHLPWARRTRDLPQDLRAEVVALTAGLPRSIPGFFEVGLQGDLPSFGDELQRLACLAPETFLYEFSVAHGGLQCAPSQHAPSIVADDAYAQEVVALARGQAPDLATTLAAAFADPAAVQARMVAMLDRYWEVAFAEEWERIRPRIEAEVTDGARTLVTAGMPGLVADFLPEGRWDAPRASIVVDKKWERECDVATRGGMLFVPTVYGWPSVLIELAEPWPVAIFFPLREMRQPEVPNASDREVADGLRALGDETRLQITRLVAEQPRSTKELATLLSLSESAVSRHLKTLAGAGVVDSQRDGYFVLYRLVPDRIGALGGALRRTLGLAQATTGRVPALPVSVTRSRED